MPPDDTFGYKHTHNFEVGLVKRLSDESLDAARVIDRLQRHQNENLENVARLLETLRKELKLNNEKMFSELTPGKLHFLEQTLKIISDKAPKVVSDVFQGINEELNNLDEIFSQNREVDEEKIRRAIAFCLQLSNQAPLSANLYHAFAEQNFLDIVKNA